MTELSSGRDIRFCVLFPAAAAAGILVAADNHAEGSVLALGLVKPLHHTRDSRDSSVPDDSVLVSWYWV